MYLQGTNDNLATTAVPPGPAALQALAKARPLRQHQALVIIDRLHLHDDHLPEPLPLGWSSVFANTSLQDLLSQMLAAADCGWSATILPEEQQPNYPAAASTAHAASLIGFNGQLRIQPHALAPQPVDDDSLCIILNGHQFPLCDLSHAIAQHRQSRCDATVVELAPPRLRTYDERLRIDSDGMINRVDRVYEGQLRLAENAGQRDWPAMIILSHSAMQRLLNANLPRRLGDWPGAMLRAGLRMHGRTLPGRCYDLHEASQLRELSEAILRHHPQWLSRGNLLDQGQRIWIGQRVTIAPTAQILGPVAIGDDVQIAEGVVVVGPTVIGHGTRIGAGVVIRHELIAPHSLLPGQPIGLDGASARGLAAGTIESIASRRGRSSRTDRPIHLQTIIEADQAIRGGFRHRAYCCTKRLIDIVGALAFLACSLPFYPFIALAIVVNSPGRVLYGHIRQGRGGRAFKCWKFRTMIQNAEQIQGKLAEQNEVDGPQFKIRDDPRIFAVGRWLRRLNVDEWPQFFNVLVGEMSLVGPRPSPERENQICPAWREARLSVRPGITGLWQVCRRREVETDFQEWIYYDVQYVKKQSIRLDLLILVKTIRVALKGS